MFHAEIEATNFCNTRCLHCPHEVMSRPRGRMTWPTFETITRQIREHTKGGRYSLSFSGMGEPLLNPLLPRFIAHVAHEARTSFACNGAVLTPENVRQLRDAGLDMIYLSFNGDEAGVFAAMMGGLSFDRVLGHLRSALALTRDSRLEIRANVSVTKATQPRLGKIRDLLLAEGVKTVTLSQCHSRGGNLRDAAVCDTPASPPDLVHCDVVAHTLFVDWRGKVYICDHDIHGEHSLGDLTAEPLEAILVRRQKLIDEGMPYAMCRGCNDLLKAGFHLFENGVGGILSDWLYDLHGPDGAAPAFAAGTPAQRWMLQLYQKEGRLDRAANRLLDIANSLQSKLRTEEANREQLRRILEGEVAHRDARIQELEMQLAQVTRSRTWRWRRALLAAVSRLARTPPLAASPDNARCEPPTAAEAPAGII